MAESDPYFQFPLCLLALPSNDDWAKRISTIIDYGIIEFGIANSILDRRAPYVAKGEQEKVMGTLRSRLKFTNGQFGAIFDGWKKASLHVEAYKTKFPTSAGLVRMRTNLCLDSLLGKGLDERGFRVLAAIYSAIGELPFKQVTFDSIAHRSSGCVSRKVFDAWTEKAEPYSRKELRKTVDELGSANWFRSSVYRKRQKFYTHSLTDEQLRTKIFELKTKKKDPAKEKRREMDDEMTRAILAARQS